MKKVLVLDDERHVAAALARSLQGLYEVDIFTEGSRALQALRSDDYACVLSDLDMPQMSGLEFYQCVRQQYPNLGRYFIFHTGSVTKVPEGVRWVQKGVRANEIRALIESVTSA